MLENVPHFLNLPHTFFYDQLMNSYDVFMISLWTDYNENYEIETSGDRFSDPIMILNWIFLLILFDVWIDQVSERDKYGGELVQTVQRVMTLTLEHPWHLILNHNPRVLA